MTILQRLHSNASLQNNNPHEPAASRDPAPAMRARLAELKPLIEQHASRLAGEPTCSVALRQRASGAWVLRKTEHTSDRTWDVTPVTLHREHVAYLGARAD